MRSTPQSALIIKLNPIIKGWSNYYSATASKETYSKCDHIIYQQLKRWAERRHPNKSRTWVTNKYWHTQGGDNWVFSTREEKGAFTLIKHSSTRIVRHIKVKEDASPYNGDLKYWSSRMGKHPELPTRESSLLKSQKGKCQYCGLHFKNEDLWEVDHIIPTSIGGKDEYKNLQLLHRHCHDKKTLTDGSIENTSIEKIPHIL